MTVQRFCYKCGVRVGVVCVLFLLLAACAPSAPPLARVKPTSTTPLTATPTAVPAQTIPMPQTQTTCPAQGKARAAITKPLALGDHQNVVYIYNEVPLHTSTAYGRLKRYDTATAQKFELVTSGLSIAHAQVSPDGQWVLFISIPDPRLETQYNAMLQLVRMDGQGLQTLYCFPSTTSASSLDALWSPDQKSLLFSRDTDNTTSTMTLLDLASGDLQPELKITDSSSTFYYRPLAWLDNSRVYLLKQGRQGTQAETLYLLDVHNNKDLNGGDLQKVLQQDAHSGTLLTQSNADASKLFVSYCLKENNTDDTTIWTEPVSGGTQQQIYHNAAGCVDNMRILPDQSLLLLVELPQAAGYHVWQIKSDGSSQTTLADLPVSATRGESFSLSHFTQSLWSDVSRDDSMYSLIKRNSDATQSSLLVGMLQGGAPIEIAKTTTGSLEMVGWTTM